MKETRFEKDDYVLKAPFKTIKVDKYDFKEYLEEHKLYTGKIPEGEELTNLLKKLDEKKCCM